MKKRIMTDLLACVLTLSLTVLLVGAVAGFNDVNEKDWFANDVKFVVDKNLMNGTGNGHFTPNGTTTRAQAVTILYRLAGSPSVSGNSFSDVKSSDWFAKAVQWASQDGIASGYGNGKFGPNDTLNRDQLATMLYRYAQLKNLDTATTGDLSKFTDCGSVSGYALDAMSWAVGKGLIGGTDGGKLAPKSTATRAQLAAILHRFSELVGLSSNIQETTTKNDIAPVIENSFSITETMTDFSEDRAWVEYKGNNNQNRIGAIDKNGYIIWSISKSELSGWSYITATPFVDGTSCLYSGVHYAGGMVFSGDNPGMIIIDKNGNELFSTKKVDEDKSYRYMGSGDGVYLAVEQISNFSTNESSICEMDQSGNITWRYKLPNDTSGLEDSFTYLGEKIFLGGHYGGKIYNCNSHELFTAKERNSLFDISYCGKFSNGSIVAQIHNAFWIITTKDLRDKDSWEHFLADGSLDMDKAVTSYLGVEEKCISDGLVNCTVSKTVSAYGSKINVDVSRGIYDYGGKLISNVAYPDDWNVIDADGFSGGFAALKLKGRDGENYVTVIDTTGTPQYEPIKANCVLPSWHGYVSIGYESFLSPKGEVVDQGELDKLSSDYTIGRLAVRNGCQKESKWYLTSDGSYIDTVYIVNNLYDILNK